VSDTENNSLYDLLPVVHRMRDSMQGWPLRALLQVIEEQRNSVRRNIDQLYDDWFIETCAEWVVPYIGDLLGVGPLAQVPDPMFSLRGFIGNTVSFRRGKGTALVLERLAKALTRWPAVAVEYFQLLAWTQHLNHVRSDAGQTADIGDSETMRYLGGPFEKTAHTLDVRRIRTGRGRYNIANIGEFLWRLQALPILEATAAPDTPQDPRRFRFNPLGIDMPLFNPARDKAIESRSAESDLPVPLPRRPVHDQLIARQTGAAPKSTDWDVERSIVISWNEGSGVQTSTQKNLCIGNLSNWALPPSKGAPADPTTIAVDPQLGRLTFPADITPSDVKVSYFYGFSGEVGGGCYDRSRIETPLSRQQANSYQLKTITGGDAGAGTPQLQTALGSIVWPECLVPPCSTLYARIEIADSCTYRIAPIEVPAGNTLEICSSNECRPLLLSQKLSDGSQAPWTIRLRRGSTLRLAGLLVSAQIVVEFVEDAGSENDTWLLISHSTLVPGIVLNHDGTPVQTSSPSSLPSVTVQSKIGPCPLNIGIERSISGPVFHPSKFGRVEVHDSIIDNLGRKGAIALWSGMTVVERSTILGRTVAYLMELGSDSIFQGMLTVMRTQDGCMRYSCMPWDGSLDPKAPRRYRCQPVMAIAAAVEAAKLAHEDEQVAQQQTLMRLVPHFTSTQYGTPGYAQLAASSPPEIFSGASNEAEMGVFNHLGQSQRLKNLSSVLNEYLRVGFDAGIFPMT
jgi:hypothetical protein